MARRELKRMAGRPVYWFCILVAPLSCLVFFLTLMGRGLPTDLPVGLVDGDASSVSRQLARNLDAFQQTGITVNYVTVSDARRAMQRGEIYGFYYIPAGTSRKALRQEQASVSFYVNYSYLIAASLVFRDMKTMTELASGAVGRQVMLAKGLTASQAEALLQPIVVDVHPVSNPWLNYSVYLNNALLPGVLMLFITMVTVYSIGIEIKESTVRGWFRHAGGGIAVALAGKLLPHTLLFTFVWGLFDVVLYGWLHFPCLCGLHVMLAVSFLGVVASQGLGVLMFTLLPTLRLGLSFASLWGVVSFSIAGISFPVMAMHPVLQGLCHLFPLRHYFLLYVHFALNGYPVLDIWSHIAALVVFALLPLLAAKRLKTVLLTAKYVP